MLESNTIKTIGYSVSSVSVLLLSAPAWKRAGESPWIAAALMFGAAFSVTGMVLRWWSYQVEMKKEKTRVGKGRTPAPKR